MTRYYNVDKYYKSFIENRSLFNWHFARQFVRETSYWFLYMMSLVVMQYLQYSYVYAQLDFNNFTKLIDSLSLILDYTLTILKLLWVFGSIVGKCVSAIVISRTICHRVIEETEIRKEMFDDNSWKCRRFDNGKFHHCKSIFLDEMCLIYRRFAIYHIIYPWYILAIFIWNE